jgi:hypothetical protein
MTTTPQQPHDDRRGEQQRREEIRRQRAERMNIAEGEYQHCDAGQLTPRERAEVERLRKTQGRNH